MRKELSLCFATQGCTRTKETFSIHGILESGIEFYHIFYDIDAQITLFHYVPGRQIIITTRRLCFGVSGFVCFLAGLHNNLKNLVYIRNRPRKNPLINLKMDRDKAGYRNINNY